jgi:protein-S-isoprenylcysteine O-methyltransferase Ste14
MLVLHGFVPVAIVVRTPLRYGGGLLIVIGASFIVWSRRAFQAAETPIRPFVASTALVQHGLYRWSRNPMYLGAVLLVAGVAVLLGSLSPLVVVIAFFVVLQEVFIRREERLLEQTFGERYRIYRTSVRRWL